MRVPTFRPSRPWLLALAVVALIGAGTIALITVAGDSDSNAAGGLGNQVVATDAALPDKFPEQDVPLPESGLVSALANTDGATQAFSLSYTGSELTAVVSDLKTKLKTAGFAISNEYAGDVRKVPSAGFTATSKDWVVVVGGVTSNGTAAVNATVTKL